MKNILDDLLNNNTDEEIKIILSQQDNVEETVGNTLAQKYVEEIKLHFGEKIAIMKFYMEKSLNELKKNFMREYANMTSYWYIGIYDFNMTMRSKIQENKKLTNQLENIKKIASKFKVIHQNIRVWH